MEVSMQASLGGRDAVQRLEKSPAVRFGDARRFLDPGTDDVFHIREDIGIGRNGMELPAKLGEFECQGFQLLRFLRDNPCKGTFVRDNLIFGTEVLSVLYQSDGFGTRNAGIIHGLGNPEFAFYRF